MPTVTYLEAIRQGIWEEMERDPSVFCPGEDIGIYGGAFKVTDGLIDRFGAEAENNNLSGLERSRVCKLSIWQRQGSPAVTGRLMDSEELRGRYQGQRSSR